MENALYSSELYSHEDKVLEEHLINVADIAVQNLYSAPDHIFKHYSKDILLRLVKVCALCHDIGKATLYFQEYLFASGSIKNKLKGKEETHHGLLSAIAAYFAAKAEFQGDTFKSDEGIFLPFIAFLAVRRHHGNFMDVMNEAILSEREKSVLLRQVESIDDLKLAVVNKSLRQAGLKVDITVVRLKEWVISFPDELRRLRMGLRKLEKARDIEPYILTNFVFSLLIDADKSEVTIGKNVERPNVDLGEYVVDEYKTTMEIKDSWLNSLRQQAYHEVLSAPVDLNAKIMSINLPTGLGKTLTSLAFAFKLRRQIQSTKGYTPRIIYSLPFLSIIEQNAEIIERVLAVNGFDVDNSLLLKHHHLAEVRYRKEQQEFEIDDAEILIEGWNSEIVVTTFVQLFHTLLSNKNHDLRKFHRLSGSIIILDEVQSIPTRYWLLIGELFKKLIQELDTYVIFVTATEPLIFSRNDISCLVNREFYFNSMDRVTIVPRLEESLTLEEFVERIELQNDKSYLFILNTINSAKTLYELLKEKTGEEIAYLSTHVVPYERLERIKLMKAGKVRLAVTTQVVEAGVDIDFDVVYRDLAPLDSINQAAGRCNRNGMRKGEVIVVSLKDERRSYASYVYDSVLLDITRKILQGRDFVAERDFLNIIEEYYVQVQAKKSNDLSRELLEAVYKMKYESVDGTRCIADFKLIEEDYPKVDVFVELNEEAKQIWQRYIQIKEIKDLFERRLHFSRIKADFYKYTVSVPQKMQNIPPAVKDFLYVSNNTLNEYYDKNTGFITKGVTAIW
ncbi:CRISPR-associated endonuclease/helicase Cas3 [Caldicoprobacter guelmensis]|uniref:CRISPR-associated helicase Cas3' n=1 Tax=Caldicoprobacter guelmensis TaxID=1170224 RepID=UPI00195C3791|nr:CRISPR-associated helicase Cas3' [Caldicoprobacter guelmensis]MBM7582844.1 CRISPR-associated endonuclease/helicase Cas3 [Caldicoprobacter guelmensis]